MKPFLIIQGRAFNWNHVLTVFPSSEIVGDILYPVVVVTMVNREEFAFKLPAVTHKPETNAAEFIQQLLS